MNKPALNHLQRQTIKWSKWWLQEKDPKRQALYLKQAVKMGGFIFKQNQKERE